MHKGVYSTGYCKEWCEPEQCFTVFHQEKRRKIDLLPLFSSVLQFLIDPSEKKTKYWLILVDVIKRQDRGSSLLYILNKHNRKRRKLLAEVVNSKMASEFKACQEDLDKKTKKPLSLMRNK